MIPDVDVATYQRGGFMAELSLGRRAALVVVDVTFGFTGTRGLSLEQAIAEFPTASGPVAWDAIPRIATLVQLFRRSGLPIVFTRGNLTAANFAGRVTKSKSRGRPSPLFNEFPPDIAPQEHEWVLEKPKASAFFQTPLITYLLREQVDTLVFCGVSTSGCVRASVVDGFSHGFATFVIDDCCFDRSWFAHCANLFDMQAKYAGVVSLAEMRPLLASKKALAAG